MQSNFNRATEGLRAVSAVILLPVLLPAAALLLFCWCVGWCLEKAGVEFRRYR